MDDRETFSRYFRSLVATAGVAADSSVLVIGGSGRDIDFLRRHGFTDITLSNLDVPPGGTAHGCPVIVVDAEEMDLPDRSFDLIFVHAALHHCRSPHKALCEMLRVARRHVIFLEPNDSAAMRFLVDRRLSFPYEIAAVAGNGCTAGGVRNTGIPNHVHRWEGNEIRKTVATFLPEYETCVHTYGYWDFRIDETELRRRSRTRLPALAKLVGGERNFVRLLWSAENLMNRVPVLRELGNKRLCVIEKTERLKPWLTREGDEFVLAPGYRHDPGRPSPSA